MLRKEDVVYSADADVRKLLMLDGVTYREYSEAGVYVIRKMCACSKCYAHAVKVKSVDILLI